MPQAGASTGMPAPIEAWRAGFWPAPAVRIWPKMTSETSPGSTRARSRAALIAALPRSCAGKVARPPLKAPTGVRAAPAITMVEASLLMGWAPGVGQGFGRRVGKILLFILVGTGAILPARRQRIAR